MRFVMVGSGGVGGYFGGRLAAAGHPVTFVARGAHLAAIREHGLRIESAGRGNADVEPVDARETLEGVAHADVVFIGVKLWETETAARLAAGVIGPDTVVVSLQNGIDAEGMVAAVVGPDRVLGGIAYIGSSITRPGVIGHVGTIHRMVLGELGGGVSDRVRGVCAVCTEAGFDAEASPDINRAIWEKFVFLVGLSSMTALTRQTLGPVREDVDQRALLHTIMAEVVAVGRASGVDLPADYADERLGFVDTLPADMNASMHHDLARGSRIEIDWLAGAAVRAGQRVGVDTPACRFVYAALKHYGSDPR